MAYKCIAYTDGVDVSINSFSFFTFKSPTHLVTDLGGGQVRVSRKIDNLIELYSEPVSNFVDINGVPVATTYQELNTYFNTYRGLKGGEGVSVDAGVINLVSGGPSKLGGFKVGTGLTVDGSGRLSASATSEVTKVVSTEAEMLALPTESLRSYRVIRLDTKRLYYLNSETSPSVLSNWFVGPSIEATVLSFKERSGAVEPEYGDYTFDLIPLTDKTTSVTHKLVIDDSKLYIENVSTALRKQIAFSEDTDLSDIQSKLVSLDDIVNGAAFGLVKKLEDVTADVARNTDSILNETTGLVSRVTALENSGGGGTDYSGDIAALQTKDSQQDTLILQVDAKADSVASNNVILDQRVSDLESRPAGTDYSGQIASIEAKNTTQDTRLTSAEASILNKASLVSGKVPYEQLPEFPVGRKANVANKAARLGLSQYTDLTIAYESDTGDAWGLDANADPAIDANWSKLGNAQGIGVASFLGRTGNIGAMSGDYNTGQITELLDKQFVTNAQITEWSAKETTEGSQDKATAVRTYADETFLTKAVRGVSGGVAPLGIDGKVPLINLPDLIGEVATTNYTYADVKATRTAGNWYTNTSGYPLVIYFVTNFVSGADASQVRVKQKASDTAFFSIEGPRVNATIAGQAVQAIVPDGGAYMVYLGTGRSVFAWYEMRQAIASTFTPVSQKGIANGVAPLDANGKVPIANLPSGTGSEWVIPVTTYTNVTSTRLKSTWYTNDGQYDRRVRVMTNSIAGKESSFIHLRDMSGVVTILNSTDVGSNATYSQMMEFVVPANWSYQIVLATATARTISSWFELNMVAGSTFTPVSEKGRASGVAPLGADSRVPVANLPTFLPQSKRIWRDVKADRVVGTWVINTSLNEMEVHARALLSNASNRFVQFQVRETDTSTLFIFNSASLTPLGTTGLSYADSNTITVPAGWQYRMTSNGGSTLALTETWYELY